MHREWKDFLFDGLRCNCSMCKHCEVDATKPPCNTCLVDREVNGTQFVPADPKHFDSLKRIVDQYSGELLAAQAVVADVQSKIRSAADMCGINTGDFYYAIKEVSPRCGRRPDES